MILPPLVPAADDTILEVSKMRGQVQKIREKIVAEEHSVAPEAAELIQQHQARRFFFFFISLSLFTGSVPWQ